MLVYQRDMIGYQDIQLYGQYWFTNQTRSIFQSLRVSQRKIERMEKHMELSTLIPSGKLT